MRPARSPRLAGSQTRLAQLAVILYSEDHDRNITFVIERRTAMAKSCWQGRSGHGWLERHRLGEPNRCSTALTSSSTGRPAWPSSTRRSSPSAARTSPPSRATSPSFADLDRLFAAVKENKGRIDILFERRRRRIPLCLGEISEELYDCVFRHQRRSARSSPCRRRCRCSPPARRSSVTSLPWAAKRRRRSQRLQRHQSGLASFARTWMTRLKARKIRVNSSSARRHRDARSSRRCYGASNEAIEATSRITCRSDG